MAIVFKNNASTTLSAALSSSATSISVVDATKLPSITGDEYFFCTIDDGSNVEIVKVTGVSSNTLTVVRAQDNTTALSFSSGDIVEQRLTAAVLETFPQLDVGELTADEFIGDLRGAVIFKAQAGEAIDKGEVVYVSGISGNTPVVALADADDANKMPAFGLALESASLNNSLAIVTFGTISGVDTDTPGFSLGDTLYVSTTPGGLTNSPPAGESSLIQNIGKVQRVHVSSGSIKVGGAGRTNAVPNLNDGNIFIGNASNQATTASLNTKIEDYLDANGTTFPDNVKAQFGASNDLQIYHNGTDSVIDNLTGDLYLTNKSDDSDIIFRSDDGLGGYTEYFRLDGANSRNRFHRNVLFGDGVRADFGNSSDLKIYHDGSNSYINDSGTGNLYIEGTNLILRADDESRYLQAVDGASGYTALYHPATNGQKLITTSTGIDVTGTVTADGLTVDGNGSLLTLDNGSNPATISNTNGNITTDFDTTNLGRNYTIQANSINAFRIANGGDISFYDDTGTSQALYWDASAEQLNIGDQHISQTSISSGDSTTSGNVRSYFSDGSYVDLKGYGLEFNRTTSYIRPTADGTTSLYFGSTDASLDWNTIYFRSNNGLFLNGTQFISAGLNLTNIGTISSGAITSTGEVEATALDINGNGDISGNLTLGGYLAGPATFTIDPAAVGDNTGTVVIAGNLQVDGTTTTVNSTTVNVSDKAITLGYDATTDAANNNAGIIVYRPETSNAYILWSETNERFEINRKLNISQEFSVDASGTNDTKLEIGSGTASNHYAYIDLIGDATYTDYALRLIRGNSGANSGSQLLHRGTGNLDIQTVDSAPIRLRTAGADALTLDISQNATFAGDVVSEGYLLHWGFLYSRDSLRVLNASGTGWHTWATRGGGKFDLDVNNIVASGTISSGAITSTGAITLNGSLGTWSVDNQGAIMNFTRATANYIKAGSTGGYLVFQTNGANTALTLDSSQNATFAGTITSGAITATGTITASGGNSGNWNTAYGWGNHASAGYITSTADRTPLNDIRSLGTQAFTGTATTAGFISEMESDGAFDSYSSVFKTSWSYAGNFDISDAGTYGPTETAGMSFLTWTDNSSDTVRGNITVLAIAPNTGGSGGRTFIYNDQGSSYNPGWREIWTSRRMGAGTGLDADKLDAQEGSYYLNYNNFTNTPTIPTNNNQLTNGAGYITSSSTALDSRYYTETEVNNLLAGYISTSTTQSNNIFIRGTSPTIYLRDTDHISSMIHQNSNLFYILRADAADDTGWTTYSSSSASSWPMIINLTNSSPSVAFGPASITANGNAVWTAGNDGSGSGLDADLLDGNQGSSYFRTGRTLTTINTISNGGDRYDPSTNNPTNEHYAVLTYGNGGNVTGQLATHFQTGNLYSRGYNTSWSSWRTYWNSLNDGSGSGLDADTVDGIEGASLLRSDTADSYSDIRASGSTNTGRFISSNSWGTTHATSDGYIQFGPANSSYAHIYTDRGNFYFNVTSLYASGNTMWHAGNDGSGSGLDADLLDGINSASFLRSDSADTASSKITFSTGLARSDHHVGHLEGSYNNVGANSARTNPIYTIGSAYNPTATSFSNMYGIGYAHPNLWGTGNGKNVGWGQYAVENGTIHFIAGVSGTWSLNQYSRNGYTVWDAGNDGSGSGLDADLLDGLHASSFMRSDTEDTTSGSVIIAEDWGAGTYNSAFVIQGSYPSWETRGTSSQSYGWLHHQDGTGNYTLYSIAGYTGNNWTQRYTFKPDGTFLNGGPSGNVYYHQGNDASGSGLDADLLDGYHGSNFLGKNGNAYYQADNWIQFGGTYGLYVPSVNGAHLLPNTVTSYGTWRTVGSRGGYDGIMFDDGGNMACMWDSGGNGGFYQQSGVGWTQYFNTSNSCTAFGASTTSSSYEIYVHGAIYATGNITAYSDRRVKENIVPIDNALEKVNALQGVYYNRIDDKDKTKEIGFIAQEVNEVVPELVTYAEDVDQYGVKYGNTTALLVEAVKELTQQVKDLKQEIEEIKNAK